MLLAACGQKSNCSGISFGNGGGGGSGGGGVNSGGSVCGPGSNNGGGSFTDLFFYHGSNGANNAINTAAVSGTTFQVLPGISVNVGQSVVGSVIVVNKKFLYLPDQNGSGGVTGFSINRTTGALSPIAGSPFAVAPTQVTALAADPDATGGRFLFATDFSSGDFLAFTIDGTTGALTPVSGSPFANPGFAANRLKVDGTGHYLYASEGTITGDVFGYLIDQNSGSLSPILGSPFAIAATHFDVDPAGKFLLSVDGGSSQINVFPIEQGTGTLLLGSATSYPTADPIDGVLVHPNGKFVYAFGGKVALEGFQFSTGTLTQLSGSPFTSLPFLTDCQFDQAGTFLFGIKVPSSVVGVRAVDTQSGAVSAPIPDLGVQANPYFAPTN